jgi:two-component system chemotaxis sensor kinase CheA
MDHHQHMSHDGVLVALSFLAALLASYTALDMGSRLRLAAGKARWIWLGASALVLGGGIWSMHFIAMLAMDVGIPVGYDFDLTALSLVTAIAIVALGFHLVTRPNPSIARQTIAGSIVGIGVAAMHYTGMSALILDGHIHYNVVGVVLSVIIAMVAATAALWLTLNLTKSWQRAGAAVVMAVAVCGMHYAAMAATSIEMSASTSAVVDSSSREMLAVAVAAGLFLILCLSMVCVFADRRFEFLAEREAENLRAANKALTESQAAIHNLFDNAEQGFLTIDASLAVGPQCSAACEVILGQSPAGRRITDVLCPMGDEQGAVMSETLASVFSNANPFARELKLDLLPKEFRLEGRFVKASYKLLPDPGALMLILTDVSETALLAQEVEHERKRMEMIVLGFTEGEAFAALVNDYQRFLQTELGDLIGRIDQDGVRSEFYRRLHTFKGLLAQFSFPLSPSAIHEVETRLTARLTVSRGEAFDALGLQALAGAFEQDLAGVANLLGPGFDAAGGRLLVSQAQVRSMEQLARTALSSDLDHIASMPLRLLLQALASLGRFNVKSAIGLHSRGAPNLAARLEKELEPVIIEGDDVTLAPERYGELFRSLVHVFRNAVDHGIEMPEERLRAGKQSAGSIRCVVRDQNGVLEILIADDGAGIDRAALERRLIASGEERASVECMALTDLVFREGLSSRESADRVSGRGVGLAAVKAELDRLGGAIAVETEVGLGTAFMFTLPYETENCADEFGAELERIAV